MGSETSRMSESSSNQRVPAITPSLSTTLVSSSSNILDFVDSSSLTKRNEVVIVIGYIHPSLSASAATPVSSVLPQGLDEHDVASYFQSLLSMKSSISQCDIINYPLNSQQSSGEAAVAASVSTSTASKDDHVKFKVIRIYPERASIAGKKITVFINKSGQVFRSLNQSSSKPWCSKLTDVIVKKAHILPLKVPYSPFSQHDLFQFFGDENKHIVKGECFSIYNQVRNEEYNFAVVDIEPEEGGIFTKDTLFYSQGKPLPEAQKVRLLPIIRDGRSTHDESFNRQSANRKLLKYLKRNANKIVLREGDVIHENQLIAEEGYEERAESDDKNPKPSSAEELRLMRLKYFEKAKSNQLQEVSAKQDESMPWRIMALDPVDRSTPGSYLSIATEIYIDGDEVIQESSLDELDNNLNTGNENTTSRQANEGQLGYVELTCRNCRQAVEPPNNFVSAFRCPGCQSLVINQSSPTWFGLNEERNPSPGHRFMLVLKEMLENLPPTDPRMSMLFGLIEELPRLPSRRLNYAILDAVALQLYPANAGVSSSLINRLPVSNYTASPSLFASSSSSSSGNSDSNNSTRNEEKRCEICLEKYEVGDELRTLPCFHRFHKYCIDQWLSTASTCPLCKIIITESMMA